MGDMEPSVEDRADEGLHEAIAVLEKANSNLEPELLSVGEAREQLALYARAAKLAAFGVVALSRKVDDATEVARATGSSVGRAKATVDTGKALRDAGQVTHAMQQGDISPDQATEIVRAEQASPGAATELLSVAQEHPFHVLRQESRRVVLEAEQHRDLGVRQHAARGAISHRDELGMVHISLTLQPHVGTPIVNRADAVAARLHREARKNGADEPFERYRADAYAALLAGGGCGGRSGRPELVVLVSHEIAKRGWTDIREGEVCKIPGVGPVPPEAARRIAQDAFLSGVFFDGKDLRHLRRWTRNIPVGVRLALELGPPPDFDGVVCADCGNRLGTERDHVEPHSALGPASTDNLEPRCWSCHKAKTERDRRDGKFRARPPDPRTGVGARPP